MSTIKMIDVAKEAGVSKSTVSAVLHEKANVNERTRHRVLRAMKDLNYRRLEAMRKIKNRETDKTIGIILKDITSSYYSTIASGAKEYAHAKGYSVIIMSSDNSYESEKKLAHILYINRIDGVILAPVLDGTEEIEHLFELKAIRYPFVLLEEVPGIQANIVTVDNAGAVQQVVRHLVARGHTRIVHFAGPPRSSIARERIEGFRNAMSETTLVFNQEMIVTIGSQYEESFRNTKKYFEGMSRTEYPSAIICYSDDQAIAVIDALKELTITVPDDISVVGNDDVFYARNIAVPLTTTKAPLHAMGRKAAEILINNIESLDPLREEKIIYRAGFVARESIKALAGKSN